MNLQKECDLQSKTEQGGWLKKLYGNASTQEILADMAPLETQEGEIDYLQFKALSELVEITRTHAMIGLWQMVDGYLQKARERDVTPNKVQVEQTAAQALRLYQKANRLFYRVYDREMIRQESAQEATYSKASFAVTWPNRTSR